MVTRMIGIVTLGLLGHSCNCVLKTRCRRPPEEEPGGT